jgi:hypothetical protein
MPGQKRLAGALAVAAVAVAISACGSSDDQTLTPDEAQRLTSALSAVEAAINNRDCDLAQQRASDFVDAVNELPETVGTEDKETLRDAGENLEELAADPNQCKPEQPATGETGISGQQPATPTSTTTSPTTTDTQTTTTSSTTSTSEPAPETGGDEDSGGAPPSETGGPPSGTGGPPSGTGGGGETGGGGGETGGGGAVGGGTGGTGGTGTGGTGGTSGGEGGTG